MSFNEYRSPDQRAESRRNIANANKSNKPDSHKRLGWKLNVLINSIDGYSPAQPIEILTKVPNLARFILGESVVRASDYRGISSGSGAEYLHINRVVEGWKIDDAIHYDYIDRILNGRMTGFSPAIVTIERKLYTHFVDIPDSAGFAVMQREGKSI